MSIEHSLPKEVQLAANFKLEEVFEPEEFEVVCQGGVRILYKSQAFFGRKYGPKSGEVTIDGGVVVMIDDPALGKALIVLKDEHFMRAKAAAQEITDPLCFSAGCRGGANCLKRR